jgi:anaerobic selenocysteine-containing dehydrogenase
MDLKRRDFLKVVGLGAAGSMLSGCGGETAKLIPYVLPDEEIIPGIANWYASVCRECEAGCGMIVRVMEGRARKIEGNPDHPLNRGKLCARGQASLQGLYNPDRIQGPLQREGKRGEGRFKPIPWEDGISRWVSALQKHPGGAVMISRPVPGTLADLFSTFMKEISGRLLFYEPSSERPLREANRRSFGIDFLPDYDLANTTSLLSFGAPFLSHWLSPVHFGIAYGEMRQERPAVRGRFVQVEPRLSLTAASADRWVPIRPGTEGLLAIAIGRLILKEGRTNLSRGDRGRFERFYNAFSIDPIANETGVAKEEIVRLAREFYTAASPLAIGGGIASEQTNGTNTLVAINALNLLVGNINRPGGIRFFEPPDFPSSRAEVVGEQALLDLKEPSKKLSRSVLMLYQSNPLYTLPPSMRFRQVFDEADLIVSFSPFLDESTAMADLILPDHFFLESWGDHLNEGIVSVGLAQPVVIPRYDTRPVGDIFLNAANRFGGGVKERLSWTDFRTMVREQWQGFFSRRQAGQPFEAAWVEALQKGGWWKPEGESVSISRRGAPSAPELARFEGSEKEFPFHFYPFPSMALHHGEGANRPWLQELPDPMTTVVWGSWVEIHPKTAREYGLAERDLVRVISPYGEVEAPVIFFPGNPPDLISMPLGQGHTAYGRYAKGRGVNPLTLLAPLFDAPSGALATGATRVRIEQVGRKGRPVLVDQTGEGTRRSAEG